MKFNPAINLPLALLFMLPFLPAVGYYPAAVLVAGGVCLWLSIAGTFQKQANWAISWSDIGALLGLLAVLSTTLIDLARRDFSAISPATGIVLLIPLLLLGLNRFREEVQSSTLFRFLPFLFLAVCLGWTLWQGIGVDFAVLTTRLSYSEGMGNVSQMAMYAAFCLILIMANQANSLLWLLGAVIVALVLAYFLESKMLFGVTVLAGISYATRSIARQKVLWVTLGICLVVVITVMLLKPASLAGRVAVLQTVLQNLSSECIVGVGAGELDQFFNRIFVSTQAENTMGEIGPIAFNEYLQALVELGILGLLGLVIISRAVIQGKHPLLGLTLIAISFSMFPLQYIESAALWCLVAMVLSDFKPVWTLSKQPAKLLPLLSLGSLLLAVVFTWFYFQLYRADQLIASGRVEAGLQQYLDLESRFIWNDEYYLLYGSHLEAAGKKMEAKAAYSMAAGINPSYTGMIHLGDLAYEERNFLASMDHYAVAQRLRPEMLYPGYRQVYCLLGQSKELEAEALAGKLIAQYGEGKVPLQAMMLNELKSIME